MLQPASSALGRRLVFVAGRRTVGVVAPHRLGVVIPSSSSSRHFSSSRWSRSERAGQGRRKRQLAKSGGEEESTTPVEDDSFFGDATVRWNMIVSLVLAPMVVFVMVVSTTPSLQEEALDLLGSVLGMHASPQEEESSSSAASEPQEKHDTTAQPSSSSS